MTHRPMTYPEWAWEQPNSIISSGVGRGGGAPHLSRHMLVEIACHSRAVFSFPSWNLSRHMLVEIACHSRAVFSFPSWSPPLRNCFLYSTDLTTHSLCSV